MPHSLECVRMKNPAHQPFNSSITSQSCALCVLCSWTHKKPKQTKEIVCNLKKASYFYTANCTQNITELTIDHTMINEYKHICFFHLQVFIKSSATSDTAASYLYKNLYSMVLSIPQDFPV